jgi:hypothetical protein
MTVRRSTLRAGFGAIVAKGHLAMSDTLIDLRANEWGIGVDAAGGSSVVRDGTPVADLDRLTIVGANASSIDLAGVASISDGNANSATVRLRDSVINGTGIPVARLATNGATANLITDRSSYGASVSPNFDSGPGSIVARNRLIVSPGFVGNGDFHLAAGSPLIDAGTPGSVPAGALDRDGRPRASDGNGDCARVSDIGAFEYQGTKARASAPAAATTGTPVAFPASGSCVPGPALAPRLTRLRVTPKPIHIARRQGAVRFRLTTPATVSLRFAKPGKHTTIKVNAHTGTNRIRLTHKLKLNPGRYRLTATATTGQHSDRATTRFTATWH